MNRKGDQPVTPTTHHVAQVHLRNFIPGLLLKHTNELSVDLFLGLRVLKLFLVSTSSTDGTASAVGQVSLLA